MKSNLQDLTPGKFYVLDREHEKSTDYSDIDVVAGPFDDSNVANAEMRRARASGTAHAVAFFTTPRHQA